MGYNRSFRKHTRRRRRAGNPVDTINKTGSAIASQSEETVKNTTHAVGDAAQTATHAVSEGAEKGEAAVQSWFGKLSGLLGNAPSGVRSFFGQFGIKFGGRTMKRRKSGGNCPNCPCNTKKVGKGGSKYRRKTYKKR